MPITPTSNFARPISTTFTHPQQTQNTAPIVEHRCLYTHDLRRKAKRWQDGLLRFHTFNKRVMVYDIPRNYIGDTHWREDFPVQDGDEFELDRPIMVQVGEQIGSVEQDLTGLLEKRNKKDAILDYRTEAHDSLPTVPLFASGSRMGTMIPTQLRPKSLNALLGTPKSRFGRAALPLKSPHELRNEREHASMVVEPLAKRQRVETPVQCPRPAIHHRGVFVTTSERQSRDRNAEMTVRDYDPSLSEELSSDAQPEHAPTAGAKSPLPKPLSSTGATSHKDSIRLFGTSETSSRTNRIHVQNEASAAIEVDETHHAGSLNVKRIDRLESQSMQSRHRNIPIAASFGRQTDLSESIGVLPDTVISMGNSNEQAKPMVRLQMASRKPRRKLMYRDLLSQDALASENQSSDIKVGSGSRRGRPASKGSRTAMEDSLSSRHQEEQDRLEARLLRLHTKSKNSDEDSLSLPEEIPSGVPCDKNRYGTRNLAGPCDQTRRLKDMFWREMSDSVMPTELRLTEASITNHDTSLALARMDEILTSRSKPLIPDKQPTIPLRGESQPMQSHMNSLLPPRQEGLIPHGMLPLDDSPTAGSDGQPKPRMAGQKLLTRNRPSSPVAPTSPYLKQQGPSLQGSSKTQVPSSQIWDADPTFPPKVQPSHKADEAADYSFEQYSLPASPKALPFEHPTLIISSQTSPSPNAVTSRNRCSNEVISPQESQQNLNRDKCPSAMLALTSLETQPVTKRSINVEETPAEPLIERLPTPDECVRLETSPVRATTGDTQTPKTATGLPQFRPLRPIVTRQRCSMKKSVSDTSAAKKTVASSGTTTKVGDPDSVAKEQAVSPWSKEAWDLFGCGRDGVAVRYGDFCLLEGL